MRVPRALLLDVRQKIGSIDKLHREEDLVALGHDELVEAHEVLVMDVGESPELLLEAVERARAEVEQGLEGDGMPALAIEGLVDDSHPAFAYAAHDAVSLVASPLGRPSRVGRGVSCQRPAPVFVGARRVCAIRPHTYRIRAPSVEGEGT